MATPGKEYKWVRQINPLDCDGHSWIESQTSKVNNHDDAVGLPESGKV